MKAAMGSCTPSRPPGVAMLRGGGVAWIIGTTPEPGGYGIFRANPGGGWTKIPGAGVRIDVDRQGRAWVVTSGNGVLRFNGQQFVQVAGLQATDIGVGADGSVWAIGAVPGNDHGIYRFAYNTWEKIPGAVGTRIDVDPVGRAWVVTSSHAILRWNGSAWIQVPKDCSPPPGNSHVICDTNAAIGSFDPNGSVIYARLRGAPRLLVGCADEEPILSRRTGRTRAFSGFPLHDEFGDLAQVPGSIAGHFGLLRL